LAAFALRLLQRLLLPFIALTPWWDRALITAYMTTFAVVISVTSDCGVKPN